MTETKQKIQQPHPPQALIKPRTYLQESGMPGFFSWYTFLGVRVQVWPTDTHLLFHRQYRFNDMHGNLVNASVDHNNTPEN